MRKTSFNKSFSLAFVLSIQDLKAFQSLHYGPSNPGRNRGCLENFLIFCRTLALFKILPKCSVVLLWTALKESASSVQLCAQGKAGKSCAQHALATAGVAAPCWLGEVYPQGEAGRNTNLSLLQSSSPVFFCGFPLPWSLLSSANYPSCEGVPCPESLPHAELRRIQGPKQ